MSSSTYLRYELLRTFRNRRFLLFSLVFPLILSRAGSFLLGGLFDSGVLEMSQRIVLGALIIIFLIAEPDGLVALWDRLTKGFLRSSRSAAIE